MLPRTVSVVRALATASRLNRQTVRTMGGYSSEWKPETQVVQEYKASYNDLPVPEGSWQEYNGKQNSTWNMLLGGSIAFFCVTMFCMQKAGVWYLHGPPDIKNVKINAGLKEE